MKIAFILARHGSSGYTNNFTARLRALHHAPSRFWATWPLGAQEEV
jgi:hypothetical protein